MNQTIEQGKTLLVDGPASVNFISGYVEVLGAPLKLGEKIVIRDAKRMPFEVKKKAEFSIKLGEGAGMEEIEGSTIPQSWRDAAEKLLTFEKSPFTVMILGKVDAGKSGFCMFLANMALRNKLKVAIVD